MPKCLESRLALLEATQNPDGGWGYFAGKQSWLEPTAYALLALCNEPRARLTFDRGWRLVRSWEAAGGGWRGCALAEGPHWATSLVVTLHCSAGISDEALRRGQRWLVSSTGAETRPLSRLAHCLRPEMVEFDPALGGWPWEPGTSSWVEPTAHAIMALGRAARHVERGGLEDRIDVGKRMLLERRCRDGGWNYGNRRVLGADLPSYPDTTALALMALDGHASVKWGDALNHVERQWRESASPLDRAWLAACLLQYRGERPGSTGECDAGDILVAAVEAIPWNRIMAAG
jgi:hypothetical protein